MEKSKTISLEKEVRSEENDDTKQKRATMRVAG